MSAAKPRALRKSRRSKSSEIVEAVETVETAGTETPQPQPVDHPDWDELAPDERATLEQIAGDVRRMQDLRASLLAQRDEIEAQEVSRAASSPLTIKLEVVGCQFANEIWPAGPHASDIPQMQWPVVKCWKDPRRTLTDQDCRDCIHHKIIPLGTNEPPHTKRYPRHGHVLPITQEQANALAHTLVALGAKSLRRVDAEIAEIERQLESAQALQAQTLRNALTRQQGGRQQDVD